MFVFMLGEEIPEGAPVLFRKALRAVVWQEGRLLMVRTNKGDYKFPGGGQEPGETDAGTLVRETLEETGYRVRPSGAPLGRVVEQRTDLYDGSRYFCMTSIYYACELCDALPCAQALSGYEVELEMRAAFVTPSEAIVANERLLRQQIGVKRWVERETQVLRCLTEGAEGIL